MDFEKVREVIAEAIGCDIEKVTLEASLSDDLNVDSLASVELAMEIEEVFGIEIADADLPKIKTVSDIMDYLTTHMD